MSKKFEVLTENEIFLISGGLRCTDRRSERSNNRDQRTRTEKERDRVMRERDRMIRERYGRTFSALEVGSRAWNGGLNCSW